MKIKWLGHATVLITSDERLRVVNDPFTAGEFGLYYTPIKAEADVVTVSHEHPDHNNVSAIKGNPEVIRGGTNTIKGVEFRGIESYHDKVSGMERGPNTIYCFSIDGINICHVGDLGHDVSPELQEKIGPVDILLIPVGGCFTVDYNLAADICRRLNPKVVIPMHYKNEWCPQTPFDKVDDFLTLMPRVRSLNTSDVEFEKKSLPKEMEVIVLKAGA